MKKVTTQKYTAIEDLRVNSPFGACLTALRLYVQNFPKHPNFINFSWILDKGDTFSFSDTLYKMQIILQLHLVHD